MAVHIGLAEGSKEISEIYLGADESVKEVTEGYISDADGNVKEIYSGAPDPGQQVFTISGIFTVPKGVKSVDVFLVGGGGAGGWGSTSFYEWGSFICSGSGGGSGYTKTIKGVSVKPGEEYNIIVGAGGETPSYGASYNGGNSSALGSSASGGYAGRTNLFGGNYITTGKYYSCGGSAGGVNYTSSYTTPTYTFNGPSYGGNNGGNSTIKRWSDGSYLSITDQEVTNYLGLTSSDAKTYCNGQGTTTFAFGENNQTLYSYGGDGGVRLTPSTKASGTGNGGDGGGCEWLYSSPPSSKNEKASAGASGIVIIRWGY